VSKKIVSRARRSPRLASRNRIPLVPTAGAVFTDGLIELIRSPDTADLTLFLVDPENTTIRSRVRIGSRTFVPAKLDPTITRAMRFPEKPVSHGSVGGMVEEISKLLSRHSGLNDRSALITALFVLASWVIEVLPSGPQVRFVGSTRAEMVQLPRLLACLCRHAVALAEVDAAGLFSLPVGLYPTLMIRQPRLKGRLRWLLDAASLGGFYTMRNGGLLDLHTAIATFSESSDESSPAAAVVEIPVTVASLQPALLGVRVEDEIAREFQDKLLSYRVNYLNKVNASTFDAPHLAFPMRQVARCLGACVPDDPELQSALVAALEDRDKYIRVERSTSLEAVVIEALLSYLHDPERRASVHVGEITDRLNEILRGRGANRDLKPRRVGSILRALGFETRDIDSAGRGMLLVEAVNQSVHRLAWQFPVPSVRNGTEQCPLCQEMSKA